MTPYLHVISRLLQSFWHINKFTNLEVLFSPILIKDITSRDDQLDKLQTPLPTKIYLFTFKDSDNIKAELELYFEKDQGNLVNARVQIFFSNTNDRDQYFESYIRQFFPDKLSPIYQKTYSDLGIIGYKFFGLSIGVNCPNYLPFISVYVTIEGLELVVR